MLKADFHIHTVLSKHPFLEKLHLIDGINTPEEMIKAASEKGLDILAITDHNVVFDSKLAQEFSRKYNILVISGAEINIGKKEFLGINIRRIPDTSSIKSAIEDIHKQGGIAVACHPYDLLQRGFKNIELFDAVESTNGADVFGSNNHNFKNKIKKLNVPEVAGSDSHFIPHLGYTYFEVDADKTIESVLNAIKNRKTKIFKKHTPWYIHIWYYFRKYILLEAVHKLALKRLK